MIPEILDTVQKPLNIPAKSVTPFGPKEGLGSPPFELSSQTAPLKSSIILENCVSLWEEFEASPKARYFVTYANTLGEAEWDAYTTCKCLKKVSVVV